MKVSLGAHRPVVVAVGGTLREHSSTEKALKLVLRRCVELGADTVLISGADLDLPAYAPERAERTERAQLLVDSLRRADAILIGSPGYHGGISGLVKNALDYTEDMRGDARCYFDGRPVGCVATGAGWQGAVATLGALRAVVHALRGWPTPLGVAINTIEPVFAPDGECLSPDLARTLDAMAEQLLEFVAARSALATAV
ncbi:MULTISPECIES: NADPH-dependent FMN reductase [Sphingomonadaceae]|uniref:NADPH-dependent FMN reductase n=1 Tax=Sphingomonadales TaxID=204457 RepID=UPI0000D7B0F3|nr:MULTISPECIES: NAD(P)H-dependent oxidoreductase [Sphingomonadaceae]MBA38815.1 NADPH-dependent oxidoreductase [Sphingobium sp.]EAT08753.1 NADPH-dependent FMN reductase [Sphingomonas sp. SKA58]MBS48687.1 NADPH-dependent oxidoreductase [Sphingobium sp.]MCC4256058.1 NAD(P)H-dependent oxidoreductase [Sphingobium lactosutens]HCW60623.1 NADPH-dependent oxidoreductase [Sphingobium sp.]